MNSQDKLDLAGIAEGQRHVHRLIVRLDERIETLRQRLEAVEIKPPQPTRAIISAVTAPPPLPSATAEPPPLPHERRALPVDHASVARFDRARAAVPRPPLLQPPEQKPVPAVETTRENSVTNAEAADAPKEIVHESFELRLGTFWLVRVGIVIFLTGLVFLGNFAYHRFITQLGAAGKLALLYAAGATLMGIGVWLDRKQESMRNYARVLMAGGVAAIYYTTYAAHYVAALRVIESPLLGGLLLLLLAGGIVWVAERKRSELLALLAVLLAYYTSAINAVGVFTLFSSLLLTGVAVLLLVRHGWSRLSWITLVGTYASYAFWRFHSLVAEGVSGSAHFGTAFLAGYWIVFTVAVFLARSTALSAAQRTPFVTANNAAFFLLGAQHFAVHWPHSFWVFALVFGALLLVLGAVANRRFSDDPVLETACIVQGLALITVGLVAKLSGYQLAVTLAAQSVVLLTCSRGRHGVLYQLAAAGTAAGAALLAVAQLENPSHGALLPGVAVTALLLFDAWWFKRLRGELTTPRFDPRTAWFAVLALFVGGMLIWQKTTEPWQPALFVLAACACAASLPLARLPEVALCGHGLFVMGVLACFGAPPSRLVADIPVIVAALALEQWWQRQRIVALADQLRAGLQLSCALGAMAVGFHWMATTCLGDTWMLATATVGLAAFAYAVFARSWAVLFAGQVFTLAAICAFTIGTAFGHPDWLIALAPAMSLLAISYGAQRFGATAFPEVERILPFTRIAAAGRVTAFALIGGWVFEYIPDAWQVPLFAGLGAALLLFGGFSGKRSRTVVGAALSVLALALFWARLDLSATFPQLLAIAAIPAAARFAVRRGRTESSLSSNEQSFLVVGSLATVWLWLTRWTLANSNAANLTVAWSVLALIILGAGFALSERVYRLGGLAILSLAVGRIFLIDVWQLETIYRILSFLILGAVLLLLGFAYNRFAERLKHWL